MKRGEVTVERLEKMGYRGYMVSGWFGVKRESRSVLEDIVYAAQNGRELVFQPLDLFGMMRVSLANQIVPNAFCYAVRPMSPAELLDADVRLKDIGLAVERASNA